MGCQLRSPGMPVRRQWQLCMPRLLLGGTWSARQVGERRPMKHLLICLGMLALMLALLVMLTLQLLSLKTLFADGRLRDTPRGAPLVLGAGEVSWHGPVQLLGDGPYLHTDG